jgi:hypothetical protein
MTITTFLIIMLLQIAVFGYLLYRSIILYDLVAGIFALCWLIAILLIAEAGFQSPIEKPKTQSISAKTYEVMHNEIH